MQLRQLLAEAMRYVCLAVCLCVIAPALGGEADEALNRAIALFDQGDYAQAQEVLLAIDRDTLDETQRLVRDDYVDRTRVAITMADKATMDFDRAEKAIDEEDYAEASEALAAVLENEYATPEQRGAAEQRLLDVETKRQPRPAQPSQTEREQLTPPPPPPPAGPAPAPEPQPAEAPTAAPPPAGPSMAQTVDTERARALTRGGYDAMESGRYSEAARLFQDALRAVPGYPQAVDGLHEAQRHSDVEVGSTSLLDRIRQKNRINWDRAIQQYRDLETSIRDAVLNRNFDLAEELLLRARQVIEGAKQWADPLVKYESTVSEIEALAAHVAAEKKRDNERRVREQRDEVQSADRERRQRVAETRQRQVDALMEQALQARKDRNFAEAISVLTQVLAIDPQNNQARWMKDVLQDVHEINRQRLNRDEMYRQQQALLVDTEESKIPWHELLKYPDNWIEIISSPDRVTSGRERLSAEDQQLHAKLENPLPLDIEDKALEEVIDDLAADQGVNITVIWNDLEAVGIERDLPVTLRFASEVKFKKALREILDQVGGGEVQLGYVVNDGVIKIASQALLDKDVYIDVYPIEDLLISVPDFEGPTIDIAEGEGGGGGGGAGGGFGGGGGGFGGGGGGFGGGGGGAGGGFGGGGFGGGGFGGGFGGQTSGQQNPFSGGEGEGDEEEEGTREERVDALLELIRNTISPDSWRDSGGTVAAIAELGGQLVVTQTASAHSEIQDLLGKLREQRAIQIGIEARFITITSNYLEELGIDLDIVLNQGNAGFDRAGRTFNGANVLIPRSFSRLGFLPGVPSVGNPLLPASTSLGNQPGQPFGEVGLVPNAGNGLVHGSNLTPIPLVSNVIDLVTPTDTIIPNSFGGSTVPAMNLFGSFLDGIQVDFLLRATQADRRSSVMNAPRLVLFNGQRAWVGVLNATSFVQSVQAVVDENAVAQQPIPGQLQTGTVLDVQAVVSADKRYVTMNLRPGVAQPAGPFAVFAVSGGAAGAASASNAFIQLPNVQRQVIKTTVSVPDGGTLLIGGMKTTQEIETEAGVPVLSKIPVLKRLYSARNLVKDEQVLLILVKPTVIIQREQEEKAFPTFGSRY